MKHSRTTHTDSDIIKIEGETGLSFVGFLNTGRGGLVPIFVQPSHTQDERRTTVARLNEPDE